MGKFIARQPVSDVEKQLNTDDDITVGDDSKSYCLYFERQNLIL